MSQLKRSMHSWIASLTIAAGALATTGTALADDISTILGGGVGAAAGAVIGESVGGKQGAVIGGAVGGALVRQ